MIFQRIIILIVLGLIGLFFYVIESRYNNIIMTIDIANWNAITHDFITNKCGTSGLKPTVYPNSSANFIRENNLRQKLLGKLDSTLNFTRSYSQFNVVEKYSTGSGYRVYVWLDESAPIYYFHYYFSDNDFVVERIDKNDVENMGYADFLMKSKMKEPTCEVDSTMDVLNGTLLYSKFFLEGEMLVPEVYQVSLF